MNAFAQRILAANGLRATFTVRNPDVLEVPSTQDRKTWHERDPRGKFPYHRGTVMTPIESFYLGLGEEEQEFLLYVFPELLYLWFDGEWMGARGARHTRNLPLLGRYLPLDALAVALLHLRSLYPPSKPAKVFRMENVQTLPKRNPLAYPKRYRRLTSWTTQNLYHPDIRFLNRKPTAISLEWVNPGQQVLGDYKSLTKLGNDGRKLCAKYGDPAEGNWWPGLVRHIKERWNQREYICYVKPDQKFSWSIYKG